MKMDYSNTNIFKRRYFARKYRSFQVVILLLGVLTLSACEKEGKNKDSSNENRETQNMQVSEMTSTEEAEVEQVTDVENEFYHGPLPQEIKARITGISYPDTTEQLQITYEDLSYVHVLHYNFEGVIAEGELICNQAIAQDMVEIFRALYDARYPIEKICLVDEYNGDDNLSMADNNTSCFNYRVVAGTNHLSQHAYGLAIDINPLYNPYITYNADGSANVQPYNATDYVNREQDFAYKIDHGDLCYQLFMEHGFTWGGDWKNSKDYQHFQKKL